MQRTLKWAPAKPFYKTDNIISSKSRENGYYGFKPSYESEPLEKMSFIMSNEYMRLWFEERAKCEKEFYTRQQIIKEESKIKRRYVQRMMTYRQPPKTDAIDLKFKTANTNVKQKSDDQIQSGYKKLKYKPKICPKEKDEETDRKEKQERKSQTENFNKKSKEMENYGCKLEIPN